MSKKTPPQNDEEILNTFADLFDQIYPESPGEIRDTLLEAGLDPDEISREVKELIKESLASSPYNWRAAQKQLDEAKAEVERAEKTLSPTASRSELRNAIQQLLSLPRMQAVGARYRGQNLEERSDEELRALYGELKYLADQNP